MQSRQIPTNRNGRVRVMPINQAGLVTFFGVVAVRANKTSILSQCQQKFLPALILPVLFLTATGCQSASERFASISGDSSVRAANVASSELPDVTPVGFDELVTEASQLSVPQAAAVLDTTSGAGGEVVLPSSGQFSLADAESLAIATHPALAEARSRIESVRGRYIQAGLPFNPVLQFQSDEIGNEDSSGLHSVSLSQQFVTANKLGIARQVQAQEIQKQRAQLKAAELRVLTRVRAAFAQSLAAQRRVELTGQIVELTEKSVSTVQALLEAQEVSRVALLQAQVEVKQARLVAENAKTQLEANRRILAAAAGAAALPEGELIGAIDAGLTEAPWEQLLDQISTTSPELAEAGSELERARWALQLACAQVTPNVTGQLGVGVDTATDDTFATLGVSLPLPIRNRNQGNIRAARADVSVASAAIDRTQRSLESRLAQAIGRYDIARRRYDELTNSILPDAEATYELSQTAFEADQTDYLQLLTAQRTLINTELSALDSVEQARSALAEIEGLLTTLP